LADNRLNGTIPDFFTNWEYRGVNVSRNLLTGNATRFVELFGVAPFQYNCFDPEVPPSNPSC
jgi:hypothetical protein